jgi:eukaryotic-like serine/threonine-protein kinase
MNGNSDSPATKAVPNVVQQKAAAAKRILNDRGFNNVKVNPVKSDVTKGYVASTDPTGGTDVDPADQILLNVSEGPGLASVPDVSGKSVAEATQTLKNQGFTKVSVAGKKVDDSEFSAGQVVSASPGIGSMADPSQRITLSVSSGKVHVPDGLLGQESGDAQFALRQAHLKWDTKQIPVSNPDQGGKVQKVSPKQGARVNKDSTVTLTVGVYSSQTTVTITPPPSSPSHTPSSTSTDSPSSTPTTPSSTPTHTRTGKPSNTGLPPVPTFP